MNSSLNKITILLSAIILILLTINSCDSVVNEKSPASNQTPSATSQANNAQLQKSQYPNHDQKMAQLAKKIPGLGGVFFNESGQLSIYLTNPANQKAKAAAVFSSFAPLTKTLARLRAKKDKFSTASVSNMNIKKGQYTFTKLYRWRKEVTSKILTLDGVYSNGINESRNTLSIGVKDETVKAKVSKKLVELNIPEEAVTIFQMSPPTLYTSLQDQVSSFSGGIKISMSQGWCTMGPTARYKETASGSFTTGYVTASHCTPPIGGGVYGTQFYQPTLSGNFAGTEYRDPPFGPNKCWDTGQDCRESDAALISYSNSNPNLIPGSIYKTTSRGHNQGSLTISSSDPRFYIKDIDDFIFEGTENNKMGARTGWTYGDVTEICQDFTAEGITVVCQNVVQAGSNNGDSGSPVFETTADPDSVIFDGVLSGGYSENGSPYYWYSSVTRIKTDLSGSNVHDLTFIAP